MKLASKNKELNKDEMKNFNRDAVKVYGVSRFFKSVKYSIDGLVYAYRYEQSLWLHPNPLG